MKDDWEKVTVWGLYPARRLLGRAEDEGPAPDERQIEICRTWLRLFAERTRSFRGRSVHSSYHWKHQVEDWTDRTKRQREYISNGAFIEAALREGFEARRNGADSPNALFALRARAA